MKKYILPLIIIVASLILSIYFWPLLPETMASHWDAQGVVNGYTSKLFNVIAFPSLQLGLFLLFFFIPKIDPKRKNIFTFEKSFNLFISSMLTFLLLIQLHVFLWNIGIKIPMEVSMPILMGGLFLIIAELIKNAKQNYTIGIRTPWTLDSTSVWDKTHKLGATLFRVSGILSILSFLMPNYSLIIVIGSVLISTVVLFVYSYLEYKKEKKF